MSATYWLVAANAVVWVGLGMYLIILGRRQYSLNNRLQQLENLKDG